MTRILVLGASSGPGASVFLKLAEAGADVVGAGRNRDKMADVQRQTGQTLTWIGDDLWQPDRMASALDGVTRVINCGPNRWVHQILDIAEDRLERLVTLGSTRLYSRFPDQRSRDMQEIETRLRSSAVPSTILHPSLIYGWWNGNPAIPRLLNMIRRYPILPLPGGGEALIQPVMHHDVARAVLAACDRPQTAGRSYTVAGPVPVSYAAFIRHCAAREGLRARILPVPPLLAFGLAALSRAVPGLPDARRDEIERLMEDKNFDISPMVHELGVEPRPLEQGLDEMFSRRGSAV